MKSVLTFEKWTKKMSNFQKPRYFMKNALIVTIMKFYRLVTEKIILILLRYF